VQVLQPWAQFFGAVVSQALLPWTQAQAAAFSQVLAAAHLLVSL